VAVQSPEAAASQHGSVSQYAEAVSVGELYRIRAYDLARPAQQAQDLGVFPDLDVGVLASAQGKDALHFRPGGVALGVNDAALAMGRFPATHKLSTPAVELGPQLHQL
jgi:hypothetical protein